MALGDLLAALDAEDREQEQIEHDARQAHLESILAAGRAEAAVESARVTAEFVAQAEAEAAVITADAESERQQAVATARHTALDAVRAEVTDRLAGLPGTPEGQAATRRCLAEALAALPDAVEVHLHPADAAVGAEPAAGPDSRDGRYPAGMPGGHLPQVGDLPSGGALVVGADGSFVDNALTTRLDNLWPSAVVALLDRWQVRPA